MKLTNSIYGPRILNENELDLIIETAFKILENTGFIIEHSKILKQLKDFGAVVDQSGQKVFISKALIESFLEKINRKTWNEAMPQYTAESEIYNGYFLDPADNQYKPWTHELLLIYIKLSKKLSDIKGSYMLGCPIAEISQKLQPLYEKLYCWKYGIRGGEGIWDIKLCESIYRMQEIYARSVDKEIQDVFHGIVYLISPLKLGGYEAEQFWYFYERGLKVSIRSGGGTLGGTFPVTMAGALAICLAENLMIGIINYILFNITEVTYVGSISCIDMKSASFQYGRPEKSISIIAEAQIAKRLGFDYRGHSGLSDAKIPGFEAGVQKMITAMYNASVCGTGNIVAGLLGADEIFSPIQMILENELIGALNHTCKGIEVNEETLAYDTIERVGPGGNFLSSEHTAVYFNSHLWQSHIWSDQMFNGWRSAGAKNDIDFAKELYMEMLHDPKGPEIFLNEETENKLLNVIKMTV
ncbi:MAG: hypothetical protein A2Y71_06115 [Bacteroidetes bacterium RBG_13_42_15]|nr:MAG: hypothetical protein A2Y71_06115 [Bacteroidetes bacterium RBG_13_42_15]